MLRTQIIRSPTNNTVKLLSKRIDTEMRKNITDKSWGAVGLVQTQIVDLFAIADIADKSANVIVTEIKGLCPQHIAMITSSVEMALEAIKDLDVS